MDQLTLEQHSKMIGQIIGNISNLYKIKYANGYINCKARGKFRNDKLKPLVGDNVVFDENKAIITELLPRKNELVRPPICNIDQALIVASAKDPDFDTYLLDKLISIITFNNIDIIICFTKLDLLNNQELVNINKYMDYYHKIGYTVVNNTQTNEIEKLLKSKITTVTGQSGAGKSTLLNKLDPSLNLQTEEISYALGRGKHTTKHVTLLEIRDCLIADTAGFSSLELVDMDKDDIKNSIIEFIEYKDQCKYRDCFHLKEDDCKIKNLVKKGIILESRYNNYQKFIQEKEDVSGKNIRFHSIKK